MPNSKDRFRQSEQFSQYDGEDRRAAPEQKKGVKFDATINLGHILTFIGFIVAGFGAWTTLDKRVLVLEEGKKNQAQVDASQDSRFSDAVLLLRSQLEKMDQKLDRLVEKR